MQAVEVAPTPTYHADTQEETKLSPMYHVILHNDDVNDMLHVAAALLQVLGMEEQEAISQMLEAHEQGSVIVRTEPQEHAEFHQEQLQAFSLTVTIEADG